MHAGFSQRRKGTTRTKKKDQTIHKNKIDARTHGGFDAKISRNVHKGDNSLLRYQITSAQHAARHAPSSLIEKTLNTCFPCFLAAYPRCRSSVLCVEANKRSVACLSCLWRLGRLRLHGLDSLTCYAGSLLLGLGLWRVVNCLIGTCQTQV